MRRRLAALIALLSLAPRAHAQAAPSDPRAEALNEEGKALYLERQDYAGAVAKFRAAIAIRPDARYSYNLCTALEKTGDLQAALTACNDVANQNPRPDLADKASRRAAEVRRLLPTPSPNPNPTPGPNPNPPPTSDLYPPPPGHPYGWSLGVDVGPMRNLSFSSLSPNRYSEAGAGLRLRAEIVVAPSLHLGLEPYLDLQGFTKPQNQTTANALAIVNLGVALTWHGRIWQSLYFVPSAGLSFSALSVGQPDSNDVYATIGLRAEAGLEWVFGGGQHVLAVVPAAFGFYPAPIGQIGGSVQVPPSTYGLDKGGFTWAFLIGYRFRFSGTVISLE